MTKDIAQRLRIVFKKGRSRARRQLNECFVGDVLPKNKEARYDRKLLLANTEHELLMECWRVINTVVQL